MKVYDSLGRLKLNTAAMASAQPTSAQFSALSAHVEVVSARVVSVSAELASLIQIASAAATSADAHANTVSARVVSVSAELASLVQIASAAATSADAHANTVSARVVSVSAELASLIQIASAAATSADAHANTASAAATSADAHANTVSARVVSVSAELASLVQIASAAATSADAHANTVSARVVSVSAELASLVQIASAAATSADAHANAASAAATSVLNFVNGVSVKSVGGTSVKGLQSVVNALSNRISATAAGTASATSAELASVDARVNSVNTFLSGISARSLGNVSTHGVQSVVNALSSRIGPTQQYGVIDTAQGGSTLTNLTSATLLMSADGRYEVHAMFLISVTTSQPYGFGLNGFTNVSLFGGFWRAAFSVGVGGSVAIVTSQAVFAQIGPGAPGGGTSMFACTRGATANLMPVTFDGIITMGAAGNGNLIFMAGTSTGQHWEIVPGSYVKIIKLN